MADLIHGGPRIFGALVEGPINIVYSDPPWSPGNEKWWRRHANVDPPLVYDALLDAWCECAVLSRASHVFVEQSIIERHRTLLLAAIRRCPGWTLPLLQQWVTLYGSPKRRALLLHFGRDLLPVDPSNLSGTAMTRRVFEGLRAMGALQGAVADPCTGLGMTSRIAHEFGCSFVGTELNPARLAHTIGWLRRNGYVEVSV